MRFKDRKELADKYREWAEQPIDNNQTMILDCAESVITFLDINGYLNKVAHGEWIDTNPSEPLDPRVTCSICGNTEVLFKGNFCPNCGADMRGGDAK